MASDKLLTKEDGTASPPPLPLLPSPTAKAFFDALDNVVAVKKGGKKKINAAPNNCTQLSTKLQQKWHSTGWRNRHSQSDRYPLTIISNNNKTFHVTQHQRGEINNTFGTGATVWPAAVVLCKYLERNNNILQNKCIMDLGSGTAITSIAAALLSSSASSRIMCTDGEQAVVDLAKSNVEQAAVELNNGGGEDTAAQQSTIIINNCPITTTRYWWGDEPPSINNDGESGKHAYDVVLVADCVLPKLYPIAPLVQAIDDCLATSGKAILSYEHRWYPDYHPKDKFVELCTAKKLEVETVSPDQMDPIYQTDDIEIWIVTRRRS